MSMISTGLLPVASHAYMRAFDTRFCPDMRIRSWMAWAVTSLLTPPITFSICIRWNVAWAVDGASATPKASATMGPPSRVARRMATSRNIAEQT